MRKKYIIEDLELTEGQVKHALKSLKEQDKIESIGKGKNYYIIKNEIFELYRYLCNSKLEIVLDKKFRLNVNSCHME